MAEARGLVLVSWEHAEGGLSSDLIVRAHLQRDPSRVLEFRGQSTVWHEHQSAKRCHSSMERALSELATLIKWGRADELRVKRQPPPEPVAEPVAAPAAAAEPAQAEQEGTSDASS